MEIRLKTWKTIERAVAQLTRSVHDFEIAILELTKLHPIGSKEGEVLVELMRQATMMREAAPSAHMYHPQSEWLGGNSDDPGNHALREPNICPLPRRRFTPDEIAEAGAVCHGPVQWTFEEKPDAAKT